MTSPLSMNERKETGFLDYLLFFENVKNKRNV